jgi:hypothetical protein
MPQVGQETKAEAMPWSVTVAAAQPGYGPQPVVVTLQALKTTKRADEQPEGSVRRVIRVVLL